MIMEYQKMINLLDNTPDHPFKFGTKNWVEINDDSRGTYSIYSNCKYSDGYILVQGTITVRNTTANICDTLLIAEVK